MNLHDKSELFLQRCSISNAFNDRNKLIELFQLSLKEQDRDTRHACAEIVISEEGLNDWPSEMHKLIMNTSTGVS